MDETEDINVIKLPLEEVIDMLDKNEIITASTTIALMHYLRYIKNNVGARLCPCPGEGRSPTSTYKE